MGLIAPKDEGHIIFNLVELYLRGKREMLMKDTKEARARRDGLALGWREGMAEAISSLLTIYRVRAFEDFDRVEQVMIWEVVDALSTYVKPYDDVWLMSRGAKGEQGDQLVALVQNAYNQLMELVEPEAYVEERTNRRREKILKGEAEPLAEDRDWLEAHFAEASEVAARTKAMLAKVPDGLQKVNR